MNFLIVLLNINHKVVKEGTKNTEKKCLNWDLWD